MLQRITVKDNNKINNLTLSVFYAELWRFVITWREVSHNCPTAGFLHDFGLNAKYAV